MDRGINILVTGSEGQLGKSIKFFSDDCKNYNFYFKSKFELNITNFSDVEDFLIENKINLIINCAAYTNVEKAEVERYKAALINHHSVENLAKLCSLNDIQLIHISTDYVFDGNKITSYSEDDVTNPINYYGITKLAGEENILKYKLKKSAIIRTSWLYSNSENNFVSKIIKLTKNKFEINIVDDEIGSPTCANDLAKAIFQIIPKINNTKTEVYHFSNLGFCSRYEFVKKIKEFLKLDCNIRPVKKKSSKIKRPHFSALDCSKIINSFQLNIDSWEYSLKNHLNNNKYNI